MIILLVIMILLPCQAQAKVGFELMTIAFSDDNIFHTPVPAPNSSQGFGLIAVKAAYTPEKSPFTFSLKGDDLIYSRTQELSGFIGTLNLDYGTNILQNVPVRISGRYRSRNFPNDANRSGSAYGAAVELQRKLGDVNLLGGYSYENVSAQSLAFGYQYNTLSLGTVIRLFSPGFFVLGYRYGFGTSGMTGSTFNTQIVSAQAGYPFGSLLALVAYENQNTTPQGQPSYPGNIVYGGLIYRF